MTEQVRHVVDQGRIARMYVAEASMPYLYLVATDARQARIAQARRGYADYLVPGGRG
jgi:hypothetical protein